MTSFFGGLKPTAVIGREQFANHDASTTWDDGGIATELAVDAVRTAEVQMAKIVAGIQQALDSDLAAYGAHQVRDAVVDYVSNGYLEIAIVNGRLSVCFDASNDAAQFRACWDLGLLLRRAGAEAASAGDAEIHDALASLHDALPSGMVRRAAIEPPVALAPKARTKGVVRRESRA